MITKDNKKIIGLELFRLLAQPQNEHLFLKYRPGLRDDLEDAVIYGFTQSLDIPEPENKQLELNRYASELSSDILITSHDKDFLISDDGLAGVLIFKDSGKYYQISLHLSQAGYFTLLEYPDPMDPGTIRAWNMILSNPKAEYIGRAGDVIWKWAEIEGKKP